MNWYNIVYWSVKTVLYQNGKYSIFDVYYTISFISENTVSRNLWLKFRFLNDALLWYNKKKQFRHITTFCTEFFFHNVPILYLFRYKRYWIVNIKNRIFSILIQYRFNRSINDIVSIHNKFYLYFLKTSN